MELAAGRVAFSDSLRRGSHPAAFSFAMYLLYLDDAGDVKKQEDKHFILAGIAVFERQAHWLQTELDHFAETLGYLDFDGLHRPDKLELHGNQILSGSGRWRTLKLSREKRRDTIRTGLEISERLVPNQWRLFGVVVDKHALSPKDPIEYAFEQLCYRFDLFLTRLHHQGNTQRGLIILDKSAQETRLQSLASEFRAHGQGRRGVVRNLADVPLFVDSRATRCIQYADLVAYAMWRKFEKGDGEFFDVIADSFDSEGGVVHGLHHFKRFDDPCDCPVCVPTFR